MSRAFPLLCHCFKIIHIKCGFEGENMADLKEFQARIGYQFKNINLLRQALTHSSYANEKHMR